MWDDLKNSVGRLEPFGTLSKRLDEAGADVHATGLHGSSRALLLARLLEDREEPFLLIAADPVQARDMAEDLVTFGARGVTFYPGDEMLPYDYHDPDRNLTGMQMSSLEALVRNECRVLVCTARSALKRVFSPGEFRQMLIRLREGGEQDPIELTEQLARLGYERHEIVEAKGQFALRGGLLDLFEVACEHPVRIEFDGDEIVAMRDFDIETQRSKNSRAELTVRPFHHIVPAEAGIERLRKRLAEIASEMEDDEKRKALLPAERLEEGISYFGMEHYAADVHDLVPVYSYFDRAPIIVFCDTETVETDMEELREEIDRRFAKTREEGHLYPEPEKVYIRDEELEEMLSQTITLRFHGLSWKDAVRFSASPAGDYRRNLKKLARDVEKEVAAGVRIFLFCSSEFQRERVEDLLAEVSIDIDFLIGNLSSGFRWRSIGTLFLSEEEIFGRYHKPFHLPKAQSRSLTYDHSHFKPGDFVVHLNHGIGRYMGLRVLDIEGGKTECLDLRYEGDDHLFIPVSQLRMVEKHIAGEEAEPELSKLGSAAWGRVRERARKSAERVAKDLLEIYAARQIAEGFRFEADKPWQKEMEASFPYEETLHQLEASAEVKADMERESPMDRLLSGDVGFGKTEVALRAAFKAVLSGKQVALLVPTTVLAMQHFVTLKERLGGFPVTIEMLSRFVTQSRQKKIVAALAEGKIDIVVGTHRLLSKDVAFKDLGLVIVDEEHRFGVRHKERFKKMKKSVDVLSMTATPIPRTLSMAVSGLRDVSVIDTPPRNRLPIHTEILPFDDERIRDAVLREVARGGQVFFVHNRVQSIEVMEGFLRRLLPERIRIAHAHGQMKERELERRMIDFLERRFEVLLSTMIIEAGLDFPNVNTIIIDRADTLGLAQLYQLRGRVGRSDRKAYAFLLVPRSGAMTPAAVQRLQAISEFDYLGAGYRIAMRDLEIRGAGNLLGPQQSGHIHAIGLDLYTRMLKEEVARLKGEEVPEALETKISFPLPAFLPQSYVHDSEERMDIYRRISGLTEREQLEDIASELDDRFGRPPAQASNLLMLIGFRLRAAPLGIERGEAKKGGSLTVDFGASQLPSKEAVAALAAAFEGRISFEAGDGFRMVISREIAAREAVPREASDGGSAAALDFEKILNLLESFAI
jgi:transcription-repair coupling factor (superfamily II helicase)